MSTATLTTATMQPRTSVQRRFRAALHKFLPSLRDAFLLSLFTGVAFLLLGYHPCAEDGGIYAAAIAAKADPGLFPHDQVWVLAHTRYEAFVSTVALLVRLTGSGVEQILCLLQVCGLFALLASALHLARTCLPSRASAWWAIAGLSICAGLPVAGTSLYGVDPYVSARTFCTPLLLLAWSMQLRRRFVWIAPLLALAASMHPLMTAWGSLVLLFTWTTSRRAAHLTTALTSITLAAALALVFRFGAPDTPTVHQLSSSRAYWYLSQWQWYEWCGALAPPLLLQALSLRHSHADKLRRVAHVVSLTTLFSVLVALLFCRLNADTSAVARLQPLRALHLVFLVFLLLAAGYSGSSLHQWKRVTAAIAVLAVAAGSLWAMQRSLYSSTRHLELPTLSSGNDWEDGFRWARTHTRTDALFALDRDYIDAPHNDAHGFRAIALRSALPDRAKDGGIASVMPSLAESWRTSMQRTAHLQHMSAMQKDALIAQGVTWIVVQRQAPKGLICPFRNATIAVCRLQ